MTHSRQFWRCKRIGHARSFRHDIYQQIHEFDASGQTETCPLPLHASTHLDGIRGPR